MARLPASACLQGRASAGFVLLQGVLPRPHRAPAARHECVPKRALGPCTHHLFLPWSAGFFMFPGLNSGSLAGEAAHSPWQKKLEENGQNWELEDAMSLMQDLYTTKWLDMYDWQGSTSTYTMLPPVDLRDSQLTNGQLLASLGRSTFFDFCTIAKQRDVAHLLPLDDNFFVVMPRTVKQELPSLEKARLGCQIIACHGKRLSELLLKSGILYTMAKQDMHSIKRTVRDERLRFKGNVRRLHDLDSFGQNLGIEEDGECNEPLGIQFFFHRCSLYCPRPSLRRFRHMALSTLHMSAIFKGLCM